MIDIDAIVAQFVAARRAGVPWSADFAADLSDADAYAIQERTLAALQSDDTHAWKAGGVNVTAARLPRVLTSGATWSPTMASDIIVEAEVTLRFGRTPREGEEAADCIDAMCASIEIVTTRLRDGLRAPPGWKLADQQLHGVCIVGEWVPFERRDWHAQRGTITVGKEAPRAFAGTHPNGDPAFPLRWLAAHARARGHPLQAGDVVMTGAWIVRPGARGIRVEATFEGVGTTVVEIAA